MNTDYTYTYFNIPAIKEGNNVYHYTSAEALMGICRKEFWVTERHFLNDKLEFQIGTSTVLEVLKEMFYGKIWLDQVIDILYDKVSQTDMIEDAKLTYPNWGDYVISFCLDSDSALMWSEYSNFTGYCMEFDFYKLLESFGEYEECAINHGQVIYDEKTQKECVRKTLDFYYASERKKGNVPDWESIIETDAKKMDAFTDELAAFCRVYNMFFKKACFSGENEYRIIFNECHDEGNPHRKRISQQKFRIKEGIIIPYIEKEVLDLNSLKSVTIGPKNNSDIAVKGLKCFFRNQKINVDVQKSKIPLRY